MGHVSFLRSIYRTPWLKNPTSLLEKWGFDTCSIAHLKIRIGKSQRGFRAGYLQSASSSMIFEGRAKPLRRGISKGLRCAAENRRIFVVWGRKRALAHSARRRDQEDGVHTVRPQRDSLKLSGAGYFIIGIGFMEWTNPSVASISIMAPQEKHLIGPT
jgi:hypothetical protein